MRLSQRDSSLNTAHCTLEVRKTTWISSTIHWCICMSDTPYGWWTLSILTCNVYVCYVCTGKILHTLLHWSDEVLWETVLANCIIPDKSTLKMGRVRAELKLKKADPIQWSDFEVCAMYLLYVYIHVYVCVYAFSLTLPYRLQLQ